MSFFTSDTVASIADRHVAALGRLSEDEAKRLLSRYADVRRELRDRLDYLPEGTFTAQQLRGTLAQIDYAIIAMRDALKDDITDVTSDVTEKSVSDLIAEVKGFQNEFADAVVPIAVDAAKVSLEASNILVNRYDASIDAYSEGVRSMIQQEVSNAAIAQLSTAEVAKRIGKFLIGEQWKLERIARTEVHNIYNTGKIFGLREVRDQSLPDLKKALWHPMDQRTGEDSKELAQQNPVVDIDKPFVQIYNGRRYEFMAPPNRPHDRAVLLPYRQEWEQ